MKRYMHSLSLYCILLSSLLFIQAKAQESNTPSIAIGVVMPASFKGLPTDLLPVLQSKIEMLITSQGISVENAKGHSFVIYPVVSVFGSQQTGGGIKNITVVSGNLSLIIKQLSTHTVFSAVSKNIQGSGFSQEEATRDIFNQINPADQDLINFVSSAKTKILGYYNQNCNLIIQKTDAEIAQKKYETAMEMLVSIPAEAGSCYDRVQQKVKLLYPEMMKYNCSKYLLQAKTAAAGADYETALKKISMMEPSVSCGKDVKILLGTIEKKVDADKKKEWDLLFKIYDGEIEIAKAQAYAMSNFSTYWMEYEYTEVTYDSVIR